MTSLPWWRTELYTEADPLPGAIDGLAGPMGVALVKAWPSGITDPGWGMVPGKGKTEKDTFMPKYLKGDFNPKRILHGYARDLWQFAIVMRSVRLVCIDIDGKNGGLEHAKRLGMLPPTLAETSKSGNGYHLFYKVEDEWDEEKGYDLLSDHIGIETGVDIRAVGCVYHHPQQRWNRRQPALLPKHLQELMLSKRQRQVHQASRVTKILDTGDEMEILMIQDELMSDLAKPIPAGKRNNTLFAIGQKLKQAQVPGWEEAVAERATEVGLDADEVDKLVRNIGAYN